MLIWKETEKSLKSTNFIPASHSINILHLFFFIRYTIYRPTSFFSIFTHFINQNEFTGNHAALSSSAKMTFVEFKTTFVHFIKLLGVG